MKIVSDEGMPAGYPVYDYYLQNITTGQFKPDPAIPGGAVFDDLNAPSGSVPLCRPLRYPSYYSREGEFLGSLTFHGKFALTFDATDPRSRAIGGWRLRWCGSKQRLDIGDANTEGVGASSRAVVMTRDGITLHGWFLPSLLRFTIRTPQRRHVTLLAVTNRTIYIGDFVHSQIWAASLPSPPHRSGR